MNGCQSTSNLSNRAPDIIGSDPAELLAAADLEPNSTRSHALRLAAANQYRTDAAWQYVLDALAPLRITRLTTPQANQTSRLRALAWQGLQDYGLAQEALAALSEWTAADYLLIANLCNAYKNYRCAADGFIQAALIAGFGSTQLPADIHDQTWAALSLAQSGPTIFSHRYHQAWWSLQQQLQAAQSVAVQKDLWAAWRERYPSHPANLSPPQALLKLADYAIPSVGLMLPLTGPYASAGVALRDGFIAAYLEAQVDKKPAVHIYDTGSTDIAQLWERVLVDNVDVVVGPLLKPNAERFAALSEHSNKPRLLLNYRKSEMPKPDPLTDHTLYQLGIAIEDEAQSLAQHVLLAGHERVLIVRSDANWSVRAATEYQKHWPYFSWAANFANIKTLTEAVGEAMQVSNSQQRHREIENFLGKKIEFQPRARKDLDAVVAFVSNTEARALVPALRFHYADKLPVYATSQTARGPASSVLKGFNITELPVFVSHNTSLETLRHTFDLDNTPFSELYALGYDAYTVSTWLPILQAQSQFTLAAASGRLWLQKNGRFRRQLDSN
ncbi:MAG: hypothetical protein GXP16_06775 [Gammaproteobacteria bacterium]|nr:hypothetical protein [Gammaproteobacteria bacterium]